MTAGKRKLIIYFVSIPVAIAVCPIMTIDYYTQFLKFVLFLALGFFAGNALEHISGVVSKRKETPQVPPGAMPGGK